MPRSWVVISAKPMRMTTAAARPQQDRLAPLVVRQAAGRQAHGDGVVAGQHQVDHQDLEEGGKGGRG